MVQGSKEINICSQKALGDFDTKIWVSCPRSKLVHLFALIADAFICTDCERFLKIIFAIVL